VLAHAAADARRSLPVPPRLILLGCSLARAARVRRRARSGRAARQAAETARAANRPTDAGCCRPASTRRLASHGLSTSPPRASRPPNQRRRQGRRQGWQGRQGADVQEGAAVALGARRPAGACHGLGRSWGAVCAAAVRRGAVRPSRVPVTWAGARARAAASPPHSPTPLFLRPPQSAPRPRPQFPVGRIHRFLKARTASGQRVGATAAVYTSAILEYLTAEVRKGCCRWCARRRRRPLPQQQHPHRRPPPSPAPARAHLPCRCWSSRVTRPRT
jgi:hypothetical protein